MDAIEKKIKADVKQYGWFVLHVPAEGGNPPFSYSIGMYKTWKHPDVVVTGLPADRAQALIDLLVEYIDEEDARYEAGTKLDYVLEGYEVTFVKVDPAQYDEHFGRAIDFYGSREFPILQMVWPDRNRAFPWQPKCDPAVRKLQPVLGAPPRTKKS